MKLLLISGFLGSGKTTLMLAIIRKLMIKIQRLSIIENEIGELGIDGEYLQLEGLEVQELFGGCICCTLSVDLVSTLKKLIQSFHHYCLWNREKHHQNRISKKSSKIFQ